MLNKKVIHTNAAIGEGTIVKFENNIVTVEFSDKTMNFRYPDVFAKFLRLADEDAQSEVKALADKYGCEFVDTFTYLLDHESNVLRADYTYDGLHFVDAGYEVITAQIRPVLDRLLSAEAE